MVCFLQRLIFTSVIVLLNCSGWFRVIAWLKNNFKMSFIGHRGVRLWILLDTAWKAYSAKHVDKWVEHARFWIQEWNKPLRIIVYKNFVSDLRNQLPLMLQYFGYMFDQVNMHRHCCVLEHPVNTAIKREHSVIDEYKVYSPILPKTLFSVTEL